ncbi:heme-degrading monooxygenase HmoA [Haloactinospora alba]|uniref:Heme-degrading monooxygenase HmoA n=1 Tax=Haloactinospora alba TaxID=405555 RepID=A0A543NF53_9ACTN|nr:antibiotic biosynthesis monooxygenase family protein [Haloactinospora alba]TQN30465.1 heme-degrading monooxygenase HmoA [Haloactinospora alba]
MIIEHAEMLVSAGREEEFEAAFARGRRILAQAPGYRWSRLTRQVENPESYLLLVGWDTLEDHTEGFRNSELFSQWRATVGEFFVSPPTVTHYTGQLDPVD